MSFIIKNNVNKLIRTRPAKYRDKINKKKFLLLDRQELVKGFSNSICKEIIKNLDLENLNHYPQIELFYKFLAKSLNTNHKNLFLTEGCTGGIKQVIESFTSSQSNILVPEPSFVLYKVLSDLYGVRIKKVFYDKNLKLKESSYLSMIDSKTSIIFITNPGAPNDFVFKKKEIENLIIFCSRKNIIVAIDDAYFPYYNLDLSYLIKKYDNVIIMRTFSKFFGLAGLRAGYILSNRKKIKYISNFRGGYEINSLTMNILRTVLVNTSYFKKKNSLLQKAKKFLILHLKKNKIKIKSFGNANYLTISVLSESNAIKVGKFLNKKKIIVKYSLPKPFNDCILLTLSNIADAKKFLHYFHKIYGKFI